MILDVHVMMAKDSWLTNPDRWGTDRPKCDRIPAAPRILLHAPAPVHSPYLLHSKGTRKCDGERLHFHVGVFYSILLQLTREMDESLVARPCISSQCQDRHGHPLRVCKKPNPPLNATFDRTLPPHAIRPHYPTV